MSGSGSDDLEPILSLDARTDRATTSMPLTEVPVDGGTLSSQPRDCWANVDKAERLEAKLRVDEARRHRELDQRERSKKKKQLRADASFASSLRNEVSPKTDLNTVPVRRDCWANPEDTERLEANYRLSEARRHREKEESQKKRAKDDRITDRFQHRRRNRLDSPRSPKNVDATSKTKSQAGQKNRYACFADTLKHIVTDC